MSAQCIQDCPGTRKTNRNLPVRLRRSVLQRRIPFKQNAGFAVLELSAAVFVMIVGLLGVAQLCRYGIDRMRVIDEQMIAVQAIQNEIETLRATPFASLADGTQPFISASPALERLGPLVETRTIIAPYAIAPTSLKEVSVSIVWRSENARRSERSVTTLIAEKAR